MRPLQVAVTCSSNINRSMEAHAYLAKKGFNIRSFGTGDMVRLPGESPDRPNCYEFGTPYSEIYDDLLKKDYTYYFQNGLLGLIERNKKIKLCPERLQDCSDKFDVIITCDERVFDQVVEWLSSRLSTDKQTVHVINIEIQDNMEEATLGSFVICDMVTMMMRCEDLDEDIDRVIHICETKIRKNLLCCTMSY